MKKLYLHDDCIISPLGFTTSKNLENLRSGTTGLQKLNKNDLIFVDNLKTFIQFYVKNVQQNMFS